MNLNNLKKIIKSRIIYVWKNKKNLLFLANSKYHRLIISKSKNSRPASTPYISGDTFRYYSQHVLDYQSKIIPDKVNENDLVFVDIHFIEYYFKEIHKKIKCKYKLITHNGDISVSSKLAFNVDEKIINWFGQNIDVVHPKILPIPIGLENFYYYNNGIINNFKKIQNIKAKKKNKILYGFNIATNPKKRIEVKKILEKSKVAESIENWPNAWSYLKKLNQYKFIASPPGNGIDCIRTWEAMYLRVIPIVEKSIITEYFYNLGLPLYLINNWKDLINFTEKDLELIYNLNAIKFDSPALYFDFWKNKILK